MFDDITSRLKKEFGGKKFMDLAPADRDTFVPQMHSLAKDLGEFLGGDGLYIHVRKSGSGAANFYHECNPADLMNVIENNLARVSRSYEPGVFEAIAAYKANADGHDSDVSAELFAEIVGELPPEQQRAIKTQIIKMKKRLEKGEKSTTDGKDASDDEAIKDLLG